MCVIATGESPCEIDSADSDFWRGSGGVGGRYSYRQSESQMLTSRHKSLTACGLRLLPGRIQGVGECGRDNGSPSKLSDGEGGVNV